MPRRVVHIFDADFSRLKPGDLFKSYCGKRFIADAAPTSEECAEIDEKTKDDPVCKKCEKEQRKIERKGEG